MVAEGRNVDLSGIQFAVYGREFATGFIQDHGQELRDLAETAFTDTLSFTLDGEERAAAVAGAIVHSDKPVEYFTNGLADPYVAVEQGELKPALFDKQQLVLAYRNNDLIGFNVSHDTASGDLQQLKMAIPPWLPIPKIGGRRYAWQQLEVIRADERGHGVAEGLGDISLATRHSRQQATAYTWPKLLPGAARRLVAYGFKAGAPEPDSVGPEIAPRVRYVAPIGIVRQAMREQVFGFGNEMVRARQRTEWHS